MYTRYPEPLYNYETVYRIYIAVAWLHILSHIYLGSRLLATSVAFPSSLLLFFTAEEVAHPWLGKDVTVIEQVGIIRAVITLSRCCQAVWDGLQFVVTSNEKLYRWDWRGWEWWGGTDGRIGMVSQARPSCSLTLIAACNWHWGTKKEAFVILECREDGMCSSWIYPLPSMSPA